MERSIRLTATESIVPIFTQEQVTQLTPQGTQVVTLTRCDLYSTPGMTLEGSGVALKQPEDVRDDDAGARLAMTRALDQLDLSRDERAIIWKAFNDEAKRNDEVRRALGVQPVRNYGELWERIKANARHEGFGLIRGGRR